MATDVGTRNIQDGWFRCLSPATVRNHSFLYRTSDYPRLGDCYSRHPTVRSSDERTTGRGFDFSIHCKHGLDCDTPKDASALRPCCDFNLRLWRTLWHVESSFQAYARGSHNPGRTSMLGSSVLSFILRLDSACYPRRTPPGTPIDFIGQVHVAHHLVCPTADGARVTREHIGCALTATYRKLFPSSDSSLRAHRLLKFVSYGS